MAERGSKREALGLTAEDVLPEGPLQNIISLVPGPSRGSVSLVCHKFYSLEAQSRHRLVFQVPRAQAPSSSGKGPEASPTASKSLDARISGSPPAPAGDALFASADKGQARHHPVSDPASSTECIAPASPASSLDTSAPPVRRSRVPPRLAPSLSSPSLRDDVLLGASAHQRVFRDLAADIQGGTFGALDADEKHPKLLEALPDLARQRPATSPRLQPLGPSESDVTRPLPLAASPRNTSARNVATAQVQAQQAHSQSQPQAQSQLQLQAQSQALVDECVGPLVPVPSYLSDAESSFDFDPRRTHAPPAGYAAPSDGEVSEDDISAPTPTATQAPGVAEMCLGPRRQRALEAREGRMVACHGGRVALASVVRRGRTSEEPGEVQSAGEMGGDCLPCSPTCGAQRRSSVQLSAAHSDLPEQSSNLPPPESPGNSPRVVSVPEPSPRALGGSSAGLVSSSRAGGASPAGLVSSPRAGAASSAGLVSSPRAGGVSSVGPFPLPEPVGPGACVPIARPSLSLLFPGSSSSAWGRDQDRDRGKERGAPDQVSTDDRQGDRGRDGERGESEGGREGEGESVKPDEQLTRLLNRFTQIRTLVLLNLNPGEGGSGEDPLPLDGRLLTIVSLLAPNLEELHLSGQTLGWMVNDEGLCAVARGCRSLRTLVVHHWVVGRRAMAALADAGQLQSLEMDFFARDMATGPHRTVSEVARCSSLRSLHLRYCNNEDIRALAEGCPHLQKLTLLFSVLGSSLATLGLKCTDLRELTLRSCDTNPPDDPLLCLAQHCTSLRALSLHAGHAAMETGLQRLVAACPNLTRLSLEFLPLPLSLVGIAPQLAGIKELTLQWIQATDADLLALSRHCKRITMLVLSLFLNVTDEGVTALLEGCGPTLEVLLLRVKDVTDSVLGRLGECCPSLERLTLVASNITSAGVAAMLGGSSHTRAQLARLRRLRLVDCTSLDNSALEHVARFCPQLEGLGIKGCTRVTPETVEQLVASCPHLSRLEVDTPGLTPAFLDEASARGVEIFDSVPGP